MSGKKSVTAAKTVGKVARKPTKSKKYKFPEHIPLGEIITDIHKRSWKIGPSIGTGGFGEIYSATEVTPSCAKSLPYVIKIEPHENGPLFVEIHVYQKIAKPADIDEWMKARKLKSLGMPRFVASGSHSSGGHKYRFMVMERFGQDLDSLLAKGGKTFPLPAVLRIARQVLDVLEYMHSKSYVHADIKAANLLLGHLKGSENQVYLVDFGMASRQSADCKNNPKKAHNGTIEFLSRDSHAGGEISIILFSRVMSYRGDLEILAYNMLYWLTGRLPWLHAIKDCRKVEELKIRFMDDIPGLMKDCFKGPAPAFQSRGYPQPLIDNKISRALSRDDCDLSKQVEDIRLTTQYHPGLQRTNTILKSGYKFLTRITQTQNLLGSPPIVTFKRPPNLHNILVHLLGPKIIREEKPTTKDSLVKFFKYVSQLEFGADIDYVKCNAFFVEGLRACGSPVDGKLDLYNARQVSPLKSPRRSTPRKTGPMQHFGDTSDSEPKSKRVAKSKHAAKKVVGKTQTMALQIEELTNKGIDEDVENDTIQDYPDNAHVSKPQTKQTTKIRPAAKNKGVAKPRSRAFGTVESVSEHAGHSLSNGVEVIDNIQDPDTENPLNKGPISVSSGVRGGRSRTLSSKRYSIKPENILAHSTRSGVHKAGGQASKRRSSFGVVAKKIVRCPQHKAWQTPSFVAADIFLSAGTVLPNLPGNSQGRNIDKRLKRVRPSISDLIDDNESLKKLRDGTIMIQTRTDIQSSRVMAISEIPLSNTSHIPVKVEPHRFLNICNGVVTCYDLDCVSIGDICGGTVTEVVSTTRTNEELSGPKLRVAVVEPLKPASGMSGGTGEVCKGEPHWCLEEGSVRDRRENYCKESVEGLNKAFLQGSTDPVSPG
uniref:non-specific serine/threonine protein kinase n=1 Tax=Timema douglasi TaxID=61478 RepID=A0A7R8VAB4_TIMDO|nr:unnamed protein product [Timema douglasi]